MRRLFPPVLGGAALLGLLLLFAQCFSPQLPDCAYRCGPPGEEARCPPEYECREDGYCHRQGSTAACPFSMDLVAPPDLRPPPDGDGGDGGDRASGG